MSELELKIEKLIKDQILITESEAQDLSTLICELPEIKGGRVEAVVIKGDSPSAVADLVDKIIVDEIKFVDRNLKENPDDLWWKAQLHRLQSVREKIIKATASL